MAKDYKVGDFGGIGFGGGSRSSGGITGKGGKNVNPVYKDSGGHVTVRPATSSASRKAINESANKTTAMRKSGELAKNSARLAESAHKNAKTIADRVRNPK